MQTSKPFNVKKMVYSKSHALVDNMEYFECISTNRDVNIFHTKTLSEPQEGSGGSGSLLDASEVEHPSALQLEIRCQEALWMRGKMSSRNSYKPTYLLPKHWENHMTWMTENIYTKSAQSAFTLRHVEKMQCDVCTPITFQNLHLKQWTLHTLTQASRLKLAS